MVAQRWRRRAHLPRTQPFVERRRLARNATIYQPEPSVFMGVYVCVAVHEECEGFARSVGDCGRDKAHGGKRG